MKFSFLKKAKIGFVALLAVVVLGTLAFSIFGFQKTTDYGTGYEVQVSFDVVYEDDNAKIKETADTVFTNKGVHYVTYELLSDDMNVGTTGSVSVFTFRDKVSDAVLESLRGAIQTNVKDVSQNSGEFTVTQLMREGASDTSYTLGAVLAGVISAIVVGLYLLLRQKLSAALTVLASAGMEAAVLFGLIALFRLPVFGATPAVFLFAVLATTFATAFYTGKARDYKKKHSGNEDATPDQVATALECENVWFYVVLAGLIAVAAVLAFIFGPNTVRLLGLTLLTAAVSVFFTGAWLAPAVWVKLSNLFGKKQTSDAPAGVQK